MENKYLDKTGLRQVWDASTKSFVAIEAGKGLSTNDFTNELKEKVINSAGTDTVYSKEETEQKIKEAVAGVYRVKGSILFAELPAEGMAAGDTYNIKDAFTTTEAFLEGTGVEYPAGTNVAYTAENKWDCMAGTYNFDDFLKKDDIKALTQEEIEAICTMPV